MKTINITNVQDISEIKLLSIEQIILGGVDTGHQVDTTYRVHRPSQPDIGITYVSIKRKKFIYNSVDCELI